MFQPLFFMNLIRGILIVETKSTILKDLIVTLTTYTTLKEKEIVKMFKEELAECGSEVEAAHRVHKRVDYYFI
jgi:hypothetical protein